VTINALPNEVLLKIFDFCRVDSLRENNLKLLGGAWWGPWPGVWPRTWHRLILVCQRWRSVVFSSPRRLCLRIYCKEYIPVREILDAWPPFPIELFATYLDEPSVMAALEHRDRICKLFFHLKCPQQERFATLMQEPFPALTGLHIMTGIDRVLPITVLGESVPRLQSLTLTDIPFPTLPRLLLTCNDLSELCLRSITRPGYVSPDAMITGLSALTKLTHLTIQFERPMASPPWPNRTTGRPSSLTRAILPSLTMFQFEGASTYLDDLLARINAPQLETLKIEIFHFHRSGDVIDTQQIIHHSRTLGSFNRAELMFASYSVGLKFCQPEETNPPKTLELVIQIQDEDPGFQVLSITDICTQSLSLLHSVTELDILLNNPVWNDFKVLTHNTEWLGLLDLFEPVQTLRLSGELQSNLVSSLKGLGGEIAAAELLPALQNLYFRECSTDEYQKQSIDRFFTRRRHFSH
jgi:hypothetical protein